MSNNSEKGEPIYRCPSCKSIKVKKSDLKCPVCFELLPTDLEPEYYSPKKNPFKKSSGIGCLKVIFGFFVFWYSINFIIAIFISNRQISSSSSNQFRYPREYCSRTQSGKKVCIKKKFVQCKVNNIMMNEWGKVFDCTSYGVISDLVGNKSHWSGEGQKSCFVIERNRLLKTEYTDSTFTCDAAIKMGILVEMTQPYLTNN